MTTNRLTLTPNDYLAIPALISQPDNIEGNSIVFVLHGLNVCKETQIPDIENLSQRGFTAISIDAPHHGERKDGYLEILNSSSKRKSHQLLLGIIQRQAAELEELIKYYKNVQKKKVAVIGISMGGFTAFASLRQQIKPDLCIPFLASPDWRDPEKLESEARSPLEIAGPADYPEEVYPTPLFIVNAGKDTTVNSKASREFYSDLKNYYKQQPERLKYIEYPDSDHMMRPNDWFDAWDIVVSWLRKFNF